MPNELRGREMQVLIELMRDGRIPDKHIAKKIGTTQPTVTRIRQKLEREGYIKKYMAVPNYEKAGLGIIVMTFYTRLDYSKETERQSYVNQLKKMPQILFYSRGEGIDGRTAVVISAHRDFNEYENFIRDVRRIAGQTVGRFVQFLASPNSTYKPYDSTDAVVFALSNLRLQAKVSGAKKSLNIKTPLFEEREESGKKALTVSMK